MEINFKFNLNDSVVTVSELKDSRAMLDANVLDETHMYTGQIIERISQECSAGVQCSYKVSFWSQTRVFHEDELRPAIDLYEFWLERKSKRIM